MTKHIATIEDKALTLLGQGIGPETVASALGVSASRISQLLSDDIFSQKVVEARFTNLQSYNKRDSRYDTLEDKILDRLEKSLPLMIKPETILKALTAVNGAKRRGQSAPEQVTNQTTVVNLILPTKITQKFSVNENNQVIKAGEQELITIQSGNLRAQVEGNTTKQLEHLEQENGGINENNTGVVRKETAGAK